MLDKKFLSTDDGKKRLVAYQLHVVHGMYYKDIASLFDCSESTIGYWIKNLRKYHHLKDFQLLINAHSCFIEEILVRFGIFDQTL